MFYAILKDEGIDTLTLEEGLQFDSFLGAAESLSNVGNVRISYVNAVE
jgi:hypothetical protein